MNRMFSNLTFLLKPLGTLLCVNYNLVEEIMQFLLKYEYSYLKLNILCHSTKSIMTSLCSINSISLRNSILKSSLL